jgi:prophage DNA circulation protein
MDRQDAKAATPIVQQALRLLLMAAPTQGRPGADLRTACNDLIVDAEALLIANTLAQPLADCFDLAQQTGITQPQLAAVRTTIEQLTPTLLGAVLVQNSIIRLCLVTEAQVIAGMTFVSREDVDVLKAQINDAFNAAEEIAADDMAQMTYQGLIGLHAALMYYLIETQRPLPRMLKYEFYQIMPSLKLAYRLYADASRADEVRAENKIVHPAFCPRQGYGLSQ